MQAFSGTIHQMLSDRREKLNYLKHFLPSIAEANELGSRLDEALERLEKNTFGACGVCGKQMDESELLANPLQIQCISHLSIDEQKKIYRDQGFAQSISIVSFADDVRGAGITLAPWNEGSGPDLEGDISRARSVQGELLPEADVSHEEWEISYDYVPAGALSGDHCDVVRLSPGELLIVFGDAMGKGIAASMISSRLHILFRALVDLKLPVDEMLERANRIFCQCVSSANQYATILCVRATPSGTLELANAAHLPPLAIRESGVDAIREGGRPLGMFFDSTYKATRVQLERGETLLFYTDGLTEAHNEKGDEYGRERLAEVANRNKYACAREMIRVCRADVSEFTKRDHFTDDLTLLALRRTQVTHGVTN